MTGPRDQDQLKQLAIGDAEAVRQWFESYSDVVYTFVFYRVGRDVDVAADVVQETFLTALKQIHRYDPQRGSMQAWLTYLSRNPISKALRHRPTSLEQCWNQVDHRLVEAFERISQEPLPQEVLDRKETAERVQQTLANIPGNYKDVLYAHYQEGRSIERIAGELSVSEGAVKSLLHRARLAFKEVFLRLTKGDLASFGGDYHG